MRRGEHPEEQEAQEGRGSIGGPTRHRRNRTLRGEQGPEVDGALAGHRWTRGTAGGHDAAGETRYGSAERDNPLKGKPWTWQRDETSPRRQVAEQTVEDVGNVEDGT
jgi:hypothetical protein